MDDDVDSGHEMLLLMDRETTLKVDSDVVTVDARAAGAIRISGESLAGAGVRTFVTLASRSRSTPASATVTGSSASPGPGQWRLELQVQNFPVCQ
jgi:hypothetical protein